MLTHILLQLFIIYIVAAGDNLYTMQSLLDTITYDNVLHHNTLVTAATFTHNNNDSYLYNYSKVFIYNESLHMYIH